MADVQERVTDAGVKRWDVRYRGKDRRQHKRTFARKSDAQRFARAVETDLLRDEWIDPRRGRETFATWAERWVGTLGTRKPRTRESYESIVRKHLVPRFGRAPIAAIDYPMVTTFVSDLQRRCRDGHGAQHPRRAAVDRGESSGHGRPPAGRSRASVQQQCRRAELAA